MPEEAIEVNLVLKNEGPRDQIVFVREVWPLGLRLSPHGERTPLAGDFNALAEPASFFTTLKPYESIGIELSLNDYFKKLEKRRYGLNWDANLFLTNLELRFPKVKELPDYAVVSANLKKRFAVRSDPVLRDLSPRIVQQRNKDLPISVFENLDPSKKYYVSLKIQGETQPVIIQLYMDKQPTGARQIGNLVLEGFYDGLGFFDVEEGDFLIGGSPNFQITGGPNSQLPLVRNEQKIEHKRGTVSLVSRSVRQKGPISGGEIGSIFVVCLKPHPEWNEEHVPVGEVTSGLEVLDKVRRSALFSEVTLLAEADLSRTLAQAGASTVGNPEAVIKTAKGNLTVELFEDVARNTVANFVTLAESGFYNKDKGGTGKQKFFFLMKDGSGKPVLIQTGSPNNDFDGGPGYYIADEPNPRKHVKGALVMVTQQDETSRTLVPNSAGSQFFICLNDIPAYDFQERKFTIFGQVTGGLDVLDKLQEGDVLEGIEIAKKKSHPYTVNKIPAP
jgi:cyclophilin family peptidyl-prolyl cis-trans isomerase